MEIAAPRESELLRGAQNKVREAISIQISGHQMDVISIERGGRDGLRKCPIAFSVVDDECRRTFRRAMCVEQECEISITVVVEIASSNRSAAPVLLVVMMGPAASAKLCQSFHRHVPTEPVSFFVQQQQDPFCRRG